MNKAIEIPDMITAEWLDDNPDYVFVFGDNTIGEGMGGAAALRYHNQAIGFVTKRRPSDSDSDFYKVDEYIDRYIREVDRLRTTVKNYPNTIFLISKLGAGLANRFGIFEQIIEPTIKVLLSDLRNVKFLW